LEAEILRFIVEKYEFGPETLFDGYLILERRKNGDGLKTTCYLDFFGFIFI
jgi:hypothetical protein